MSEPTVETLAGWQALSDAATPGEWVEMCMGSEGYHVYEQTSSTGTLRRKLVARCTYEDWETDKSNAPFLAAARTAVPVLLAAVSALTVENTRLHAEVGRLTGELDRLGTRHAIVRSALSFLRAWPDGVTGKRMVDAADVLIVLDADARAALADPAPAETGDGE